MKPRWILALMAALALAVAVAPSAFRSQHASAAARGLVLPTMNHIQKRILSGFASFEGSLGTSVHSARARTASRMAGNTQTQLCPSNLGNDVLVNQNCLNVADPALQGRGQSQNETAIAQNPFDSRQLVAGFNDYRRGDGNCGAAFSGDGGHTWTDSTMPTGFTDGTAFGGVAREYWQGGGDPSVAWDTRGNAYYACQEFQRGPSTTNNPDQSSAVYVYRSTGDGGASWDFTGKPAVESFTTTGSPFNDKPYMTVDNHTSSPFRDRIYLTWTVFAADGTAYIFEVHSSDYGQSFSSPVLVSTTSSLCPNTLGVPTPQGSCNENQFSDPFTGPDGTLYVAYANFNTTATGNDNHSQILLTHSDDGGQTFSAPAEVGSYYDLPDCATYQAGQDPGRACVPEKGAAQNSTFRATNYPSGAVNPSDPKQVAVTFGSYINRDSKESNGCAPAGFSSFGTALYTGVKTAGACNNKILVSVSNDKGASFTGGTTDPRDMPVVNTARGQATTDQWFQWTSFTPHGTLATSYYDRGYGSDETTGNMDVSVSASRGGLSDFSVTRATSASMPLPTQFPDDQGNSQFFGDYTGVTSEAGAHPLWPDTRTPDAFLCPGTGAAGAPPALCRGVEPNGLIANDQTIYTNSVPAP